MIKFINKFVFNSAVAKFFVSLIIASMLWLLTVLANKYSTIENFPVRFINLPQNKVLINKLPATIAVELNSAGFRLMLMRLNLLQDTLMIDASASKVWFDAENMWVALHDGRQLSIPLIYFPRLARASPPQREKFEITNSNEIFFFWPPQKEEVKSKRKEIKKKKQFC